MSYFFKSIFTLSFWKYTLFSKDAIASMLAAIGFLYFLMELMDFFSIYTKDQYSKYAIIPIIIASIVYVILTRLPLTSVSYKVPKQDYVFNVKIGDLFSGDGDVVISTNTTFDTDTSSGLISNESIQGQFAIKFFSGNTGEIDRQIGAGLQGIENNDRPDAPGKKREYPIGTVCKVTSHGRNFYFVAMSRLNTQGNAKSSLRDIEDALNGLWSFVAQQGDLRTIVIPLMGTGRGRVSIPRKKMIERIAQSFADASKDRVFSNKLTIVVHPDDAENFGVNLFEVKDYLARNLHT